ncbi:branched-chain amino acid aminotransferase II [Roridomyces roridus]|uniref:Branched-chain amino acid aminotransferase II n=1 Tax=Roridomyces roridus TaxID=1738132 RepID=A0AAD7BL64_9AGAR|nr:branched-chain amino acid aminotransferase II [Roridomyces roridus]
MCVPALPHACMLPHAEFIAKASQLKIQLAETLKPVPPPGTYTFGDIKTDHMLVMSFDPANGWSAPEIKPYGPLAIDPSSNCLQYATNIFEGMKAFMGPSGKPQLFRPQANMARLSSSAARMALPPFDEDALLTCITKLVALESRWLPAESGHSLYIRPTMIGTKPTIKVGASDHALLYVIVTPVGPYFPTPPGESLHAQSVSLLAVSEHVRSWPGGTGGYKFGLNYSPGFVPQQAAAKLGYDQVLWLLDAGQGAGDLVTEAGAMNFAAVFEGADGALTVVTPPLDGTILPGITRDSALTLLRTPGALPSLSSTRITVEERVLPVAELSTAHAAGTLRECFGVGTAVNVVGIDRIGIASLRAGEGEGLKVKVVEDVSPSSGKGLGPVGRALWDMLLDLKEGRSEFGGWGVVCE